MTTTKYMLGFHACGEVLRARLRERPPARIQLLTGPRQVGKTTLLLSLLEELGPHVLYEAMDSPAAALPGHWDRVWQRAEATASREGAAVLLLDEVHHATEWASRLKGQWDRIRRHNLPIHVVATGSSALGLAGGSRESLAGRFERLTLTHWSARDLCRSFSLPDVDAVEHLVSRGSYPGSVAFEDPHRWAAYIRDAIVEPAIGRDILALGTIRKPALLRQVFALAASHPCSIVSLQKLQGQLQDRGALETIAHYLQLLEDAYLVVALHKHSDRPLRRRKAPPKLLVLNNALCAVIDPRGVPEPSDAERYGTWVENACLAHAWCSGQSVAYWREEPHEVDAVLDGSWGSWAVEVKTGAFSGSDLHGLTTFTSRYPAFRPLVLCDRPHVDHARRLGLDAMSWQEFLLGPPPPVGARGPAVS